MKYTNLRESVSSFLRVSHVWTILAVLHVLTHLLILTVDSLGFCQVNLQCDLETCTSRNQSRTHPVPTEVIMDMVQRLESPNPRKNSWETNSISLNTTDNLSKCDM